MSVYSLASLVRVVERPALEEFLRSEPPESRPQPEQMACAGRVGRVTGVIQDDDGRPRHVLADLPGLWPGDWLRPL
ncbi:MAG: hypothetical protein QNK04_34260 [Myxococcota bacterium]|nr:hypothetical protein [Myxococcota bacterium]